ncbi:MAG TPA: type VI secretion system-associated protein VasI [Marinobacter sp.]|nr:type VI secretion system-associated protein VasI [Marinobacter sp.]
MTFSSLRKALPFIAILILLLPASLSLASQLNDARQCTEEIQRLERLACFDQVFDTPFVIDNPDAVTEVNHPERWRQAFAQTDDQQAVVYRDTGAVAGHLVTVPALGVQPPRPLLVLQCHNNITELSLMLPEPLAAERVSIGFGAEQAAWRVRDNGFLVSGGRGLPAIQIVKTMVSAPDISLRASQPVLDGLVFDLSGFNQAIRPLRSACGW